MSDIPDFSQFTKEKQLEYSENGITWGFTTKVNGDARKPEVIEQLQKALSIDPKATIVLEQVHGTTIAVIDSLPTSNEPVKETDGIVTALPGVFLTAVTADCVPIILIDAKNKVIGVSHQGWKGSLARMAIKMVASMEKAGATKETIQAYIGPSIGMCCYNVEKDRYLKFKEEFYTYHHLFTKVDGDKQFLNLAELNVQQLLEAGIGWGNVTNLAECTSCNAEKYYSYRRDSKEEFGEMLAYAMVQ